MFVILVLLQPSASSIFLQWYIFLLNPIFRDDHHLQTISNLNMPLHRAAESILDEFQHMVSWEWFGFPYLKIVTSSTARDVLVFEVHLIVKEWHYKAGCSTCCSALFPLKASHWIVAVERSYTIFIYATEDGVDVERKEALRIEEMAESLGTC